MAAISNNGVPSVTASTSSNWFDVLRLPQSQSMLSLMATCGVCRRCSLRYLSVRDWDAYRLDDRGLATIMSDRAIVGNRVPEFKQNGTFNDLCVHFSLSLTIYLCHIYRSMCHLHWYPTIRSSIVYDDVE
jgi:hypothetical protein